jgi:hypothetical protein
LRDVPFVSTTRSPEGTVSLVEEDVEEDVVEDVEVTVVSLISHLLSSSHTDNVIL